MRANASVMQFFQQLNFNVYIYYMYFLYCTYLSYVYRMYIVCILNPIEKYLIQKYINMKSAMSSFFL